MIRGNLYKGPRQSCLSTCLLIRLQPSSATSPSCPRASQRRWYERDQFQISGKDSSSPKPSDGPSHRPLGFIGRPNPFSRQPPPGQQLGDGRPSPFRRAPGPPPRPPPSQDFNGPPKGNSSAGGEEQEWGQLTQRSPFQRQGSPTLLPTKKEVARRRELANKNIGSTKPASTFRSEPILPASPFRSAPVQPRSALRSEPIRRARDGDSNAIGGRPQNTGNFWSELESRVGSGTAEKDGARHQGAGGRIQRTRGPPRTGGAQAGMDNWPRNDAGGNGERRNSQWQDEPQQPLIPEIDVAISDFATPEFDPRNNLEHHRKPRKEKPATSKAKPKVRRRDRGFEMEDDDDFDDLDEKAEERRRRKADKKRQKEEAAAALGPTPILLPQFISVVNLGSALRIKPHIFLRQLVELGFDDITLENVMTGETAALIAQEYGYDPTVDNGATVDLKSCPAPEDPSTLPERPPIVTIMGHVDHGKTTMLDWLRRSSVAAQEHGGITQHIGAFSVKLSSGKQITFLDTPGHAAFLTMRQRGASVTDIVILVVAADDSVKPQTLEALKHARASNVPIIVAINKVDKDEARIDQVKADLARNGIEIEDFGGDVQVACVSGKTGLGMDNLEENILTLSEILDVRADPGGMAEGWVLESSVKPVGRSASVLVKRGTLRKGDIIAAGTTWAKIRMLRNEAGAEVDEAPPGTPVEILGWKGLPDAGDEVLQAPTEARAKEAIGYRLEMKGRERAVSEMEAQERKGKEKAALAEAAAAAAAAESGKSGRGSNAAVGADDAAEAVVEEDLGPTTLNFTVKGDVMGSVEAVCAAIMEIGNNEVRPLVLRSAPGHVTEFDIEHAAVTKSAVVNFNSPLQGSIKKMAEDAGVPILDHTVIYHLIDDIKDRLSEQLAPTITSRVLGEAEVLQVFPINLRSRVFKNIAGCRVRNGQVTRGGLYRLFRKNKMIFQGKLEALKQGKKDVGEMRKGTECGISFEEWDDIEVGDKIQAYEEIREKRRL